MKSGTMVRYRIGRFLPWLAFGLAAWGVVWGVVWGAASGSARSD